MKIATSYFYQIRFFKKNMLPVSTAVWDPKWFHDFQGQDNIFYDKNGVVNGVRCEVFAPQNQDCRGTETCEQLDPGTCSFLTAYHKQLSAIPIQPLVEAMQKLCDTLLTDKVTEPIVVFIVHEAPDKACSERGTIQQYFRENGIECNELTYPIQ